MDKMLIGIAMTDAREALLQIEAAREDLGIGVLSAARLAADTALDYTLATAQDLCTALGYTDLRAQIEALRGTVVN